MTEDDTFKMLKRVPAKEAIDRFSQWWMGLEDSCSLEEADEFLKTIGWTYDEMIRSDSPGRQSK